MATLAAKSSVALTTTAFETYDITVLFNQIGRWQFVPTRSEYASQKPLSRTFGPEQQTLAIGPLGIPGTLTIFNDSDVALTYGITQSVLTASTLTVYGSLVANTASTTMSPASANVTISPTGTGTVTIAPATAGEINNMSIGATTRRAGYFTAFAVSANDQSGTPGNVTSNNFHGRCAIAAGASSVTVTNTFATTSVTVFAIINQATADATLTQIVRMAPTAGSFTIYGNAAATGNVVVDWMLISF
jgi:hypothetical protein